jgi:hypothetical protein
MRQSISKKIELVSNVAIIILALLAVAVFARILLVKSPRLSNATPHILLAGSHISLEGANWSSNERTLLLILSVGCRYCSESADFYRKIVATSAEVSRVRLIAVLPQNPSVSRRYLEGLGVHIETILSCPLPSLGIFGTPTLLLVDDQGIVKNAWRGRLSQGKELEVLKELK